MMNIPVLILNDKHRAIHWIRSKHIGIGTCPLRVQGAVMFKVPRSNTSNISYHVGLGVMLCNPWTMIYSKCLLELILHYDVLYFTCQIIEMLPCQYDVHLVCMW